MKNKTLFIGCGGSGIKTLQRVNELLSGNPETRQIMRENISYMIFDLDVSETKNFERNIRAQLGNAGLPFIKSIQVTRNVTNLEEIVRPTFDELQKQVDDEAISDAERADALAKLNRLKQNWWYSPSHDPDEPKKVVQSYPFRAQNITEGLNQGAGQCGPVSFLAAWNYLPNLKRDLQEVVEAVQLRNTDAQGVGLNVVVVAGTAGGTGRGCWQPLAFKVSQTLREMGYNNNPIGVFFDSTCFKNVKDGSPNERLNLSVNSLTAMSELSAWMMQPVIKTFQYALPNLKNPSADLIFPGIEPAPESTPAEKKDFYDRLYKERKIKPYTASTDVIAVPADGDTELAPITAAYLIFGNNGVASLADNNQYHEMAAAALYAMVAQDEFIGPGAVNRHEAIRSFGALTFEVPTIPIRRYMEALVRRSYSESLYDAAVERPKEKRDEKPELQDAYCLDDEAIQLVDTKDYDKDHVPFFVKTRFCVDQAATGLTAITPNYNKATLLQEIMGKCAEAKLDWQPDGSKEDGYAYPTATAELRAALEGQDVEDANAKAEEILSLSDFDDGIVLSALEELGLNDEKLDDLIKKTVLDAFSPTDLVSSVTNEMMGASLGRAQSVLNKIRARLELSITNLGGNAKDFAVKLDEVNVQADKCAQLFASSVIEPRSQKKLWEFKRFSKAKIDGISDDFQGYVTCALFFRVRKLLIAKFRKALGTVAKVDLSLKTFVKGLNKVGKYYEGELCEACGIKDGDIDKAYSELFVDEDPDAIYKALPKMDATSNVYKRVLRPIMSKASVEALIRGNIDKYEKPIRESLSRFVRDLIKGDVYATDEDAAEAIRTEFVRLISENVSLKYDKGTDFMTNNFKFEKILFTNVRHWDALLEKRAGSEDMVGEIKDRLRKYLGATFTKDKENGHWKINAETLWFDIVTSMAGDCKPWMELSEGAHDTYLTTIALVPVKSGKTTSQNAINKEDLVKHVKEKYQEKVLKVCLQDGSNGDLIPRDRIIVYSAMAVTALGEENPFDSIHSLDYYKEADYSSLLVKAEDEENVAAYYYPIHNPAARVKWGEQRDTHGYVSPIFFDPALASTRWRPWKKWDGGYNAARQLENDTMDALLLGFLGAGEIDESSRAALADTPFGKVKYPLFVLDGKTSEAVVFNREPWDEQEDGTYWDERDEYSTILTLKSFLAGKGKTGLQKMGGAPLEKNKEAGNKVREIILKELDLFRRTIAPKVGKTVVDKLKDSLSKWLDSRFNASKAGAAKELWQDLQQRVSKFRLTEER